jgi:glycerol-3-phosphate acyltransferase PlsY
MRVSMILFGLLAYLLGAVPFGLLIGLARGVDIRKTGSGNIGATNVFRSVGRGWGALALTLDALKGLIPAALFPVCLAATTDHSDVSLEARLLFGCLAVVGHNWPVYLRFRGGKGIATTGGALIGIAPAALGVGVLGWLAAFLATRFVSVASIVAAIVIPAAAWFLYGRDSTLVPAVLTLLGVIAILRHRSNIGRLLKGQENRVDFRRKS